MIAQMMKNLMKIFENIREKRMNINKIWNNENFNNKILKQFFRNSFFNFFKFIFYPINESANKIINNNIISYFF